MNTITVRRTRTRRPMIVGLLALLILTATIAPAFAAGQPTLEQQIGELDAEIQVNDPPEVHLPDPTDPVDDPPAPEAAVPLPDPEVIDDLQVPPPPRQSLTLTPGCDPDGFDFVLKVNTPAGGTKVLQWRPAGTGLTNALITSGTGFIAGGEGTFEARGMSLKPTGAVHSIMQWQLVTVRCETERPTVTIDVHPVCDPDGIAYAIDVENAPQAPAYTAEWREFGGGIHTVDGKTGHLPTGEGAFEVRGVLGDDAQQQWRTEWVKVVVDCTVDPVDPPDEIRPGIPTFTG